jgi:hypothetical protein
MFSKSKYAPIFASAVCPGTRLYWMLLVFSLTSVFEGLYPSNGLRELAAATGAANLLSMCEVKTKIARAKLECDLAIVICAFKLFLMLKRWKYQVGAEVILRSRTMRMLFRCDEEAFIYTLRFR